MQLGDRHFNAIVHLIEGQVGIRLPAVKRTMVEGRLRKRARALNLIDLKAYGRHVFDEGHLDHELTHLIDCVTTNKTDFFREPAHFDYLRSEIVPRLQTGRQTLRLKIWSAAASTGAEAYTIAMVLHDLQSSGSNLAFSILGTDISTAVLKVAVRGVYGPEMLEEIPTDFRRRYVMVAREAERRDGRIVPELRRHVRFQRLNLMEEAYAVDRDVDIIFCRNVLIYFDKPTQRTVIERLGQHLRPGGYLIVGHSESMTGVGAGGLVQVASTVFRRQGGDIR